MFHQILGGRAIGQEAWRQLRSGLKQEELVLPRSGLSELPDLSQLPLDRFPLVADFEVIVVQSYIEGTQEPIGRPNVYFFSEQFGVLTWLAMSPWELRAVGFTVPLGNLAEPFWEEDQSWELIVGEQDDEVYVLVGRWDASATKTAGEFPLWFKVPKQRYLEQWEKTIELVRSV